MNRVPAGTAEFISNWLLIPAASIMSPRWGSISFLLLTHVFRRGLNNFVPPALGICDTLQRTLVSSFFLSTLCVLRGFCRLCFSQRPEANCHVHLAKAKAQEPSHKCNS